MSNKRAEQVLCIASLAIVMLFACSILVRTATQLILVKRMGITNAFTDMVLFDVQNLNEERSVDWVALYPFSDAEKPAQAAEKQKSRLSAAIDKVTKKVDSVKSRVDTNTTDYLVGYQTMVNAAKKYEDVIQWNYTSFAEYNGIVKLDDGYLTSLVAKKDVSEVANSTIELANYCERKGIDFLYIQAPYKISKYDDKSISGTVDFSNQNADAFLALLEDAGVDTFDIREVIFDEKLPHHELFYRTDHHWRAETGFWASRHILQLLKESYGYDIDPSVLDNNKFDSVDYPAWFLGSQGKKVTLSVTTPDDFSLLYPKYPTDFHYVIPDKEIDVDGDFSVTYDMSQVDVVDYYNKSPYLAYNYGNRPLITVENKLCPDNGKILLIHDSFGDAVISFLSLGLKNVAALDLRYFTGSVHSFIESEKPDAVLLLYNPNSFGDSVDWSTHKSPFDFR